MRLLLLLTAVAACGDSSTAPPDACTAPIGYPEQVTPIEFVIEPNYPVVLDGSGAQCDQLIRGILDPATRHPALAALDAANAKGRCSHDAVTNREIVRIDFPTYGGLPNLGAPQELLAHVNSSNKLVHLAANFLPAGHLPTASCLKPEEVAARVPGNHLRYDRFHFCVLEGPGQYDIVSDDEIEVGDEGVMLDAERRLRRVRSVAVFLLAGHVTDVEKNSTLYCCQTDSVSHCVGAKLYVDAVTGKIVDQAYNCITC